MFSAGLSPAQLISAASEACRNGSKVQSGFPLVWSALASKNPALKLGELHVADNSCREGIFKEQCSVAVHHCLERFFLDEGDLEICLAGVRVVVQGSVGA